LFSRWRWTRAGPLPFKGWHCGRVEKGPKPDSQMSRAHHLPKSQGQKRKKQKPSRTQLGKKNPCATLAVPMGKKTESGG